MKKIISALIALFVFESAVSAQNGNVEYGNNPNAGHYAAINGIKLYYETYGSGQPLIMLHENGGSINSFRNQIPFFEKYYKVIAIDSRLQGKSGGAADTLSYDMMARDFATLLDFLHLDSVYVLGWSDGGINALLLAMDYPKKVKKLAETGANTIPDTTALYPSDFQDMRNIVSSPASSAKEKTYNRMMLYQPQIPFADLKKITCPALIMAGDHDMIRPEHTLKIFQSIPSALLSIFPDSHHNVCQQHPEIFNKTVLDFFKR